MASSGVQVLIPETGKEGLEWIADVDDAGGLFFVGAWLVVFGGVFALVALVGFYEPLRGAGPAMILAPVLAVAPMTLVTISRVLPLSMGYELVPGYLDADATARASIEATFDTLANLSLALNYTGDTPPGAWSSRSMPGPSSRPAPCPAGSAGSASCPRSS
jgi:hypothetical protein